MTHLNPTVLINALKRLEPRVSCADTVCLALRALGHDTLAERYADAATRMNYWYNKPDYIVFGSNTWGDPADAWTDEEKADYDRNTREYWAIVAEIRTAIPESAREETL